ncbi:hypothetical protein Q7P37_000465 [Cladosporium fusiforme]
MLVASRALGKLPAGRIWIEDAVEISGGGQRNTANAPPGGDDKSHAACKGVPGVLGDPGAAFLSMQTDGTLCVPRGLVWQRCHPTESVGVSIEAFTFSPMNLWDPRHALVMIVSYEIHCCSSFLLKLADMHMCAFTYPVETVWQKANVAIAIGGPVAAQSESDVSQPLSATLTYSSHPRSGDLAPSAQESLPEECEDADLRHTLNFTYLRTDSNAGTGIAIPTKNKKDHRTLICTTAESTNNHSTTPFSRYLRRVSEPRFWNTEHSRHHSSPQELFYSPLRSPSLTSFKVVYPNHPIAAGASQPPKPESR